MCWMFFKIPNSVPHLQGNMLLAKNSQKETHNKHEWDAPNIICHEYGIYFIHLQ